MTGLLKSQRVITWNSYRRLLSTQAVSLNEEILSNYEAATTSNIKATKINNILTNQPSEKYLKSISLSSYGSNYENPSYTQNEIIKREIYKLIDSKNYNVFMDLLLQWTTTNVTTVDITKVLSPVEFSYLIKNVINFQKNLINQYTNFTPIIKAQQDKSITESIGSDNKDLRLVRSKELVDKIRKLYSNLLYVDSKEFIYHKDKRLNVYDSKALTGYKLTVQDYENLITLELNNFKLDLASKWFQRFEDQFENHLELMTYNMWRMKLQTYCGGLSNLWHIRGNELSEYHDNPRRGYIKSETSFLVVLNQFLIQQRKSDSNIVFNNDFNETLIYCIGYSKNTEYLVKYIKSTWGIGTDGSCTKALSPTDPRYPNIPVVKAILSSFSYNNKFFDGMKYLNAFQDHYDIDTSTFKSKSLWEQIFKWCNHSTKYNEKMVLSYYLNQTSVDRNNRRKTPSLAEAQRDANFDYEGYLTFMENLKAERIQTFEELWKLHTQESNMFSNRIYKIYLDFLREELDITKVESNYYDFLTKLSQHHQQFSVSKDSFNRKIKGDIDLSIYNIYLQTMRSLIDFKWKNTYAGQCQYLIQEWSIDREMETELTAWFELDRMPKYREMIEKKRQDFMVGLQTEEKESFLDLM
jgi:ATPase expression protein 2